MSVARRLARRAPGPSRGERVRRAARSGLLVLAAAAAACAATPPDVMTPPDTERDMGRVFADAVISFAKGGTVTSCLDSLPGCGGAAQGGTCAANPAVGPNDGMTFDLGMSGRIELGFLCSAIVEHGGGAAPSPDFKIWSTVMNGGRATVEVSKDGTKYESVDFLTSSDQTFALDRIDITEVRFVRITDLGAGGVAIDAVEAL
jgi:hypothetical protein